MTKQDRGDFTHSFERAADGAVLFQCDQDAEKWPWLALHPANNIALQATNYYALTGVSLFLGEMDAENWSALTTFSWRIGDGAKAGQHPVSGRSVGTGEAGSPDYACTFYDDSGNVTYEVEGAGVVFRTRDFEGWRAKAKAEILALPRPDDFPFAEPAAAGVETPDEVFVTPLQQDARGSFVNAMIDRDKGFGPIHPYHGGSGDHVNSSHLCDVAQQAARIAGRKAFPSGGTARFTRYVELDRPFRIGIAPDAAIASRVNFDIEQAGKPCASLRFDYDH